MAIEGDGFSRLAFLAVEPGVLAIDDRLKMNGVAGFRHFDGGIDGGGVGADADVSGAGVGVGAERNRDQNGGESALHGWSRDATRLHNACGSVRL